MTLRPKLFAISRKAGLSPEQAWMIIYLSASLAANLRIFSGCHVLAGAHDEFPLDIPHHGNLFSPHTNRC